MLNDYNGILANEHYFGASNSTRGFVSRFEEIFSRERFKKLFILKGGPGTGKSTLLKKILREFEGKGTTEAIWCSSDPNSLDGAIIDANGTRIGVVDGTAPHELGTRYPGAIDELIDLGQAFRTSELEDKITEILKLNREKKLHYEKAYKNLSLCGDLISAGLEIIYEGELYSLAESIAKTIDCDISINRCEFPTERFMSSISRFGYKSIPQRGNESRVIGIPLMSGFGYAVMKALIDRLSTEHALKCIYKSPLDERLYEGFETYDCICVIENEGAVNMSSTKVSDVSMPNIDPLPELCSACQSFLSLAVDSFSRASDAHFALEDIYSQSINFYKVNEITESLISYINTLI